MDQNTTGNQNVDNDLQKAIDNITNNTSVDPVFSDPVAAPSSIPEGDTGELDEPVGPFTEPPKVETKIEVSAPAPDPIAPLEAAANIPDLPMPGKTPAFANPFSAPNTESISAPAPAPEPTPTPAPAPGPTPKPASIETPIPNSAHEVKEAALRDLIPLVDSLNIDAEQKFAIYRDIIDELKDYSILKSAYDTAKQISDASARAEALIYLIQSIDKM